MLIIQVLFHPLDLIKLAFEFNVVAHQKRHFLFRYFFQLPKGILHNFINSILNFIVFLINFL